MNKVYLEKNNSDQVKDETIIGKMGDNMLAEKKESWASYIPLLLILILLIISIIVVKELPVMDIPADESQKIALIMERVCMFSAPFIFLASGFNIIMAACTEDDSYNIKAMIFGILGVLYMELAYAFSCV